MKFVEIPVDIQAQTIDKVQKRYGMPEQVIEKDWWVSAVLRALFALPYADRMSFKGGTSLSNIRELQQRLRACL